MTTRARAKEKVQPIREATEQEWLEIIDSAARFHLKMSGEEFIRRWNAGEFPNPDGTPVMNVAMLLIPLGDKKLV